LAALLVCRPFFGLGRSLIRASRFFIAAITGRAFFNLFYIVFIIVDKANTFIDEANVSKAVVVNALEPCVLEANIIVVNKAHPYLRIIGWASVGVAIIAFLRNSRLIDARA
jgi:hypothetical protein